ncbi:lytic murein transglycosylase [Halomonas elongata]|nr:lytic murein transglycosylase [Halomonas elongata]
MIGADTAKECDAMTFKLLPLAVLCAALVGCQSAQSRDARAESPATAESAAPTAEAPVSEAQEADFETWLANFRRQARGEGIDEATLARALDGLRYRPRVIELDGSQPEFVRPIWEYLDSAVSASRVKKGRERLAEYRDTVRQMSERYGVPGEVLVAIWGIESSYGDYLGDFSTLEALATLAYDGRRRDFARGELLAALRIIEAGDISPERMKGSWAGAMGHTQFIPSSFLAHAVDGDGDGRRDIWNSIADVLASTANYLDEAGWREGEPWGTEVSLPQGFDYTLTEPDIRRSSAEWAAAGVRSRDGHALPDFASASVIAPAGAQGPAFLVGHNFRVILRYNNATSYALAVATLSDAIAGRDGIQGEWPREQPALKRSEVREMQQLLDARGFDVGTPDGILGPNTRRGLRAFQREIGVTPDGFATKALLERLRR